MHEFADLATLAVGTVTDFIGVAATYTPPGGGTPVSCTIMVSRADSASQEFTGHAKTGGYLVEVRVSEIAAPARGGVFAVGTKLYSIVGDPVLDVPFGINWSCMTA
jgi:hypothetical protein